MLLIIDNTKDLKHAVMTPQLLKYLREFGVEYKVVSKRTELHIVLDTIKNQITGVILTGGPLCLSEPSSLADFNKNLLVLLSFDVPILGICFGFQVIAGAFGATLRRLTTPEEGLYRVDVQEHPLFEWALGCPDLFREKIAKGICVVVYQHHCDTLEECPYGFDVIASSGKQIEAIAHRTKPIYGLQFHPERSGPVGKQIIKNFVRMC